MFSTPILILFSLSILVKSILVEPQGFQKEPRSFSWGKWLLHPLLLSAFSYLWVSSQNMSKWLLYKLSETCLKDKSTINGHVQQQTDSLPKGIYQSVSYLSHVSTLEDLVPVPPIGPRPPWILRANAQLVPCASDPPASVPGKHGLYPAW